MGTTFEVRLGLTVPGAVELATLALDVVDELEAQLTVYRDDSEISRINASAHLGPMAVEPSLLRLLKAAIDLGHATGGAYDVAAGALSAAWGFTRGPRHVPSPEKLLDARDRTGVHHLRLDMGRNTIAFDRPGVVLNLGGIGKGYAIDRAVSLICKYWWPTGALVHGGRSSLYALGSPPGQFGGRWEVAVRNPFAPELPLGTLRVRNRGMGTSGDAFQRFESGGRTYGHIIDPRTGEPPQDAPASVTVLAPTAAEADALSTAFYLLGPDASAPIIEARPGVSALFVLAPGSPGAPPRLRPFNLDDADFVPDPDAVDPRRFVPKFLPMS
jgi:thiamine biosynthesis lipoprotein